MKLRTKLIADYYVGGLLHVILKPAAIVLGKILRRKHRLLPCRTITIVKMMGGGSLAIAYPSLLALKRTAGLSRLQIVTTPAILPFAKALGVFDEILVIRDGGVLELLTDSVRTIRKLFLSDAVVDLEVHSRLTTVFCLITCARNRIGFYTESSFWRRRISSHLLFCNFSNGIFQSYDQIAQLFEVDVPSADVCRATFRCNSPSDAKTANGAHVVAVAPCCSELSRERMLETDEWCRIVGLQLKARESSAPVEVHLLGSPRDRPYLDGLREALGKAVGGAPIVNHAGDFTLKDSIRLLASADVLLCIDSALLHFARLLGVPTVSFWGPTDPRTLLRPWPGSRDEIHYRKISCSPCVHLAQRPPCNGNNICMRLAADPRREDDPNPVWIIDERAGHRHVRLSAP